MICPCCGNENEKNAKSCVYCGYELVASIKKPVVPNVPVPFTSPETEVTNSSPSEVFVQKPSGGIVPSRKKDTTKLSNNKVLLGIIGILVVIIGAIWFIGSKSKVSDTIKGVAAEASQEEADTVTTPQAAVDNSVTTVEKASDAEVISEEESNRMVSDLEESVGGVVLSGVPKAAYYFGFDETLNGAVPLTRTERFQDPYFDASLEPKYTEGVVGNSIYLDGSYGLVLDSVQPLGDAYTVAFWLNSDYFNDYSPIIQIGSDILDTNQRADWVVLEQKTGESGYPMSPILWSHQETAGNGFDVNPTLTSLNKLNSNEWYYLTIVIDGYTAGNNSQSIVGKVYVNGQKVGEGDTAPMSFSISDSKAFIGINPWDVFFLGKYDEMKLWNTALSESQVNALYMGYVNY